MCQAAELRIQRVRVTLWPHERWLREVFTWNLCLGHISLSLEDRQQPPSISEQMHSLAFFPQPKDLSVNYNFLKN